MRRPTLSSLLLILLAIYLAGSHFSGLYIHMIWFRTLGQLSTFLTQLSMPIVVGLVGGLAAASLLFVNLWLARGSLIELPDNVVPFPLQRWFRPRLLTGLMLIASSVFGLLFGLAFSSYWLPVLLYMRGEPFGVTDPIFGIDISFYVFSLPVLRVIVQAFFWILMLVAGLVGALYFLNGAISMSPGHFHLHQRARRHLAILAALLLLLRAGVYWLSRFNLLYSERGVATGASFTDIQVLLPILTALAIGCLLLALVALLNVFRPMIPQLIWGVIGIVAISFVGGGLLPALVQQFYVRPNEIALESPYIERSIEATRQAYGLDRVKRERFAASDNLTAEVLNRNAGTIENVRLWDWRVLESSFQQLQGIRSYYRFNDMDVDRYMIDGELRQVLLSAREIAYDQLPAGTATWVNERLVYTHGFGVVASPASEVTAEGQPPFWIQDIPPRDPFDTGIDVESPGIYFGERTNQYVIVRTSEREFDYPSGDGNVYADYEGERGIPVGSLLNRLALAWQMGDLNLLISSAIEPESQALIFRNVRQRLEKIAPFLRYDRDPYLVVVDGELIWIQDAYTVTSQFPYSQPQRDGTNYIRNSVKATVNAYDGSVNFYVTDEQDPLIRSYARIFPDLLRPVSEAPESLRSHFRYPEDLFSIQANIFARYHMSDPGQFYNQEDLWQLPDQIFAQEPETMVPYYVIMVLPGQTEPEFVLMIPFTPYGENRDNMIAWMAARNDGEHYGEIIVYDFPRERSVLGPMQIESRITQEGRIAEQITLWTQQGSQVIRGNLLVVPIEDSILYIEPLYLQARSARLPELRRVIVAYGNRSPVMARTLGEALAELFGPEVAVGQGAPQGTPGPAEPQLPDDVDVETPSPEQPQPGMPPTTELPPEGQISRTINELGNRAQDLFERALSAQRQGDWAEYGRLLDELKITIDELNARIQGDGAGR